MPSLKTIIWKAVRNLLVTVVILSSIGAGVIFFTPWKDIVAEKIAQILSSKGLTNPTLSVASLGWEQVHLENLKFGDDDNLIIIPELTANYTAQELWSGKLRELSISDITLTLRETQGKWVLEGLPKAEKETKEQEIDYSAVKTIPFETIKLPKASLNIIGSQISGTIPFSLQWNALTKPNIAIIANGISIEKNTTKAFGNFFAELSLDENGKSWSGKWGAKEINILQKGQNIPRIAGAGTLKLDTKNLSMEGALNGQDKAFTSNFVLNVPLLKAENTKLTLRNFAMPWSDGKLSTSNVNIPLGSKKQLKLDLSISKASLSTIMQNFTGEKVSATGSISGKIPVTIEADGKISVGKGTLSADTNGVLSMPPDTIPGEGPQIDMTRQILEAFNYKLLSLTTQDQGKEGLVIFVALEGNNPKVQEGRPVKLNIRLTGDLLDFITSSAIVFSDPQSLIQQETK